MRDCLSLCRALATTHVLCRAGAVLSSLGWGGCGDEGLPVGVAGAVRIAAAMLTPSSPHAHAHVYASASAPPPSPTPTPTPTPHPWTDQRLALYLTSAAPHLLMGPLLLWLNSSHRWPLSSAALASCSLPPDEERAIR